MLKHVHGNSEEEGYIPTDAEAIEMIALNLELKGRKGFNLQK